VQGVGTRGASSTLAVTTTSATTKNNRLIVEVAVWSAGAATVSGVTDNAGDTFTKVSTVTASDKTQLTVWTAVVVNGGTQPLITATASGSADIGISALEYAGLSTAAGAAAVDVSATGTGNTSAAATVASAATAATTADGELAVGVYA